MREKEKERQLNCINRWLRLSLHVTELKRMTIEINAL